VTDRICPHNERVWMICWPTDDGLVPVESTGHNHQADAWAKMEGGKELAEQRGYVAKRFHISLTKGDER